jgi:hypothetical protein
VLPEQVGERLIRQFLKGRHPVAAELLQLVESVVVEGDQFAQLGLLSAPHTDAASIAGTASVNGVRIANLTFRGGMSRAGQVEIAA